MHQVLLEDLEDTNDMITAIGPFSGYLLGLTLVQNGINRDRATGSTGHQ